MSYENPWLYLEQPFDSDSIGDNFGFVYKITNLLNGRSYIGRKYFWSFRTPPGKKRKQKQDMHLSAIATGFSKGIEQMLNGRSPQRQWLDRVLHDQASPHTDHDLTSLPMDTRVAILDYIEAREEFLGIETGCNDHY